MKKLVRKRTAEEQALFEQIELALIDTRAARLRFQKAEEEFYAGTKPRFHVNPTGAGGAFIRERPPIGVVQPLAYALLDARDELDRALLHHATLKDVYARKREGGA